MIILNLKIERFGFRQILDQSEPPYFWIISIQASTGGVFNCMCVMGVVLESSGCYNKVA